MVRFTGIGVSFQQRVYMEHEGNHTVSFDNVEASKDPRLGSRVGNYHVLARIGEGGFGVVYRAQDLHLGREVALKFMRRALQPGERLRFEQEAKALALLGGHPHIVQIFAWGEEEGVPYLVLEYLPDNSARLRVRNGGSVKPQRALEIAAQAARALQAAHDAGIVHGDVKPENILLTKSGTAKLGDFGLARMVGQGESSRSMAGPPGYLAPEQLRGETPSVLTDIYSLGATLCHLLTGNLPHASPPSELDLSNELRSLIERAAAENPVDRFRSAAQFADALEARIQPAHTAHPAGKRGLLATASFAAVVVMISVVANTFIDIPFRAPAGTAVLAEAETHLEKGELTEARQDFQDYLSRHPSNDAANYGLGFALLLQNELQGARAAFASLKEESLRMDGTAALAWAEKGREALPEIEAAARAGAPYALILLAEAKLGGGDALAAVQELKRIDDDDLHYAFQRTRLHQTLGMAEFRVGNYSAAIQEFQALEAGPDEDQDNVHAAYLEMAKAKANASTREDLTERIARLKQAKTESAPAPPRWENRPLRLWILPAFAEPETYAKNSGIAEALPWRLAMGISSQAAPGLDIVDREFTTEVLAEQQLAAELVAPGEGVRIGSLLGAHALVQLQFRKVMREEFLTVQIVNIESTRLVPVGEFAMGADTSLSSLGEQVLASMEKASRREFPLRARVKLVEDEATLGLGSSVGVQNQMRFELFESATASAPVGSAVVVSTTADAASVKLEGVPASEIPADGFYAQEVTSDA